MQHAELLAKGCSSSGTGGDRDKESSQQIKYSKGEQILGWLKSQEEEEEEGPVALKQGLSRSNRVEFKAWWCRATINVQ